MLDQGPWIIGDSYDNGELVEHLGRKYQSLGDGNSGCYGIYGAQPISGSGAATSRSRSMVSSVRKL